jgi:hypothetical protein
MAKAKAKEESTDLTVEQQEAAALAKRQVEASWGEVTQDDFDTPWIKQLQGLSPEITDGMEGAKLGMFINSGNGELIKMETGFVCVPIAKVIHYVEWVPREKGGGFAGTHAPTSEVVQKAIEKNGGSKFGKLTTMGTDGSQNELQESHDVFMALLTDDGKEFTGECALMAFNSTAIKSCKDWWGKMWRIKPKPELFTIRTRITGFKDPRTQKGAFWSRKCSALDGVSWKAGVIDKETEPDLYEAIQGVAEGYNATKVTASYKNATNTAAEAKGDDEIPF